jgi:hypothetical protein
MRIVDHTQEALKPFYVIGLDLGQARDFTAVTVLEVQAVWTGEVKEEVEHGSSIYDGITGRTIGGSSLERTPVTVNHYQARHLERMPLQTSYPAQVARVKEIYSSLSEGDSRPRLVVDQTGVGRPVVDMLRAAKLPVLPVTITGGDRVNREGGNYRVPKRDLVSTVQVLLQAERLKIARALPEAQTLINELLAFKVTITASGRDKYGNDVGEWRENSHDDLVLAVAVGTWWGERRCPEW